ncbi:MFS general substrate transporter [Daedalea quercina L-15889]|uniref:MFS general substrate transporter n=1 Tax=Daedalea quercina L-15889 TaxID=1314783 RepID=A0A165LLS8_9APHY|nr:MFS general substrate transporter [Daedalea quercina L-15889]
MRELALTVYAMEPHRVYHDPNAENGMTAVREPATGPRSVSEGVATRSRTVVVALALLCAAYYLNVFIIVDAVFEILYSGQYEALLQMWNAFFIGQIVGQISFGTLCDSVGPIVSLCASTLVILLGGILCTAACGIRRNTSGMLWLIKVARGIVGVGIGGIYPSTSMIAIDTAKDRTNDHGRAFLLMTNGVFSAGGILASVIFIIVLSAGRPEHLHTIWPVSIGIGIVLPVGAVCYSGMRIMSRLYGSRVKQTDLSSYFAEFSQRWLSFACICCLWFVYSFVAYPKIVFSGVIISTMVNRDIWRVAGFELLLGIFVLCGSLTGVIVYGFLGARGTILVSLVGYAVFALIIGCAYDRLVKIVPLFVILYAMMLFMGSLGPGNLLSLITVEWYPEKTRGLFYGITAAIGTAGAVSGIHVFHTIDQNLRKQWVSKWSWMDLAWNPD